MNDKFLIASRLRCPNCSTGHWRAADGASSFIMHIRVWRVSEPEPTINCGRKLGCLIHSLEFVNGISFPSRKKICQNQIRRHRSLSIWLNFHRIHESIAFMHELNAQIPPASVPHLSPPAQAIERIEMNGMRSEVERNVNICRESKAARVAIYSLRPLCFFFIYFHFGNEWTNRRTGKNVVFVPTIVVSTRMDYMDNKIELNGNNWNCFRTLLSTGKGCPLVHLAIVLVLIQLHSTLWLFYSIQVYASL